MKQQVQHSNKALVNSNHSQELRLLHPSHGWVGVEP